MPESVSEMLRKR